MDYLSDLFDRDDEARELTAEEFATGVSLSDLPPEEQISFSSPVMVYPDGEAPHLHIYGDLAQQYAATGADWRERVNDALREGLRKRAA